MPVSDRPSADDLLVLLAVGRTGRFTTAADLLGLNHTTVSRRIASLERDLGGRLLARASNVWELTELGRTAVRTAEQLDVALHGLVGGLADDPAQAQQIVDVVRLSATDGFSAYVAAPAAAELRRTHPLLTIEIVTATRQASHQRTGLDIEIVVGEPAVHRAEAVLLTPYRLGLYASPDHLREHPAPESAEDLAQHGLVYFIDSMLQVDELDLARSVVPTMRDAVTSTNVFVHVEATRAGAGIGFLPCFMADRHDDLVRVLPDQVGVTLEYWMVTRPESSRRPGVAAVAAALARAAAALPLV